MRRNEFPGVGGLIENTHGMLAENSLREAKNRQAIVSCVPDSAGSHAAGTAGLIHNLDGDTAPIVTQSLSHSTVAGVGSAASGGYAVDGNGRGGLPVFSDGLDIDT